MAGHSPEGVECPYLVFCSHCCKCAKCLEVHNKYFTILYRPQEVDHHNLLGGLSILSIIFTAMYIKCIMGYAMFFGTGGNITELVHFVKSY